jgi:hypothetical protein
MWFMIDMGSAHSIERVTLEHTLNAFPRGFDLEISTDAQAWQPVGQNDDNWDRVDVSFPPTSAAYVRVTTTRDSDQFQWGIAEFYVWRSSPNWLRGSDR